MVETQIPANVAPGGDRQRGIDRVITLLEALLRHRAPIRPAELARMIGAPRSTTYEIINRLVEAEMLEPSGSDGQIYFGRAMHLFGWAYGHHNAHYRRIAEALDRLAADGQATAQVCALRGNKYVVLDSRDGPGPFRISSDVGAEVPIPWTASGRLLLGHLSDAQIRDFIPAQDFRLPRGEMLDVAGFIAEVRLSTRRGYARTLGLADNFTCCLAVPITSARGAVNTTLCYVLPADADQARQDQALELLRPVARQLSLAGP